MTDMQQTCSFLVEIGTEELPPAALLNLSEYFTAAITRRLSELNLSYGQVNSFATPRRLAVQIEALQARQADHREEITGPPVAAAFDAQNQPTKVAIGFARSHGLEVTALEQRDTDKGKRLVACIEHPGQAVATLLPDIVAQALQSLPIPKRMRWSDTRTEFIRPVHWLLMLLDKAVVDCTLLGLTSDRITYGHRFHHPEAIALAHALDYRQQLQDAYVIADFTQRRTLIREQVTAQAAALDGQARMDAALLDEVTSLVEWPCALSGRFDDTFLQVPQEALISSMQAHQKYFPVLDAQGQLKAHFITVANIDSQQPELVIAGNERVIRPRLADAAFFFNSDKKTPLAARIEALQNIVFQQQLGSLHDKVERLQKLVEYLAAQCSARIDVAQLQRAALLAKADLSTDMVYEFNDLQGIAGYYYALEDGESEVVARAIKEHYLPRFAGDALPQDIYGTLLAIADRVDTLVGIFGIGQKPTGSKDPFALRRASLSVLRLIIEKELEIDLRPLLEYARTLYADTLSNTSAVDDALTYILERLRTWYEEQGIVTEVYLAVAAKALSQPLDIDRRIRAVTRFSEHAAASSLAAANKRVSNLLAKNAVAEHAAIDSALLTETAEQQLLAALQQARSDIQSWAAEHEYSKTLLRLAELQDPINTFFDQVMVMSDDDALRHNRLALLQDLRAAFLQVADISCLAV